jgi:uncharacterized protein (TIGR02996 family)
MLPAGDEAPFLRSILAAYGEDGPRLLYADYLEDSPEPADQARAEFIRLQLALGAISEDHPRRRELTTRQNNLLMRYHGPWTAHLAGLAAGFQFRRGLLDSVSVDAGSFIARGEELFRRASIRRVKLSDTLRHLGALSHCPHLGRVRELDLCGNDLGNGGLNLLLRSRHLLNVERLDLSHNGLDGAAPRILAEAGTIPRLRDLGLSGNPKLGEAGAKALEPLRELAPLRRLDLSGNDLDGPALATLLEGDPLKSLHSLALHGNHLGDSGMVALAGSPVLDRMLARSPRLDLRYNRIGAHGLAALAGSARLVPVVSLDLTGNSLGDGGIHALALSEFVPKLRRLSIGQNRIGDWGAAALSQSPLMKTLSFLDVSQNGLTQRGIDALFAGRKNFDAAIEYAGNFATVADSRGGSA